MVAVGWERAERRIAELSRRGLGVVALWEHASEVLADRVPHLGTPCWYTLDPSSLLITSHVQDGMEEFPADWLLQEYLDDDVNKLADVATSAAGVATLHEATGGDPSRSPRWHENMRYGGDQELIAGLRTAKGAVWGAVGLYREPGAPLFSATELAFLRRASGPLAEGARRALLYADAVEADAPDAPGLVLVARDLSTVSVSPGTGAWFQELGDDASGIRLPAAVYAVAGRALAIAEPGGAAAADQPPAEVSVRGRSGRWIRLFGTTVEVGGDHHAAVIIEPTDRHRLTPLLMAAFGLTDREQQVTRLVLGGSDTQQIASTLRISPHTVQEHLKHVFDKTGVRSRRELIAQVFTTHYEPRVRDNEVRVRQDRPLRSTPLPAQRGAT